MTPSSGLFINAKCAESPLSKTFTNMTSSKTFSSTLLGKSQLARFSSSVTPTTDHMTDSVKRSGITRNLATFLVEKK